jgi:hypothetical protein
MAGVPPALPIPLSAWDAEGVPGWPRGRAGHPAGGYTHPWSVCAWGRRWARWHRHMRQTVESRGNPAGQRYRSGMATPREHQVEAWGRKSAESTNLLGIPGGYPPRRVPARLTLYTGDVLADPLSCRAWEAGFSGTFRDSTSVGGRVRLLTERSPCDGGMKLKEMLQHADSL